MSTPTPPLVWIDLEMTGLDLDHDVIIEIASIVTHGRLEEIVVGPSIVIHAPDDKLDGMSEVVTEMHASSGLTDDARRSTVTVAEAEKTTLEFLRQEVDQPMTSPLAGNSVHADRAFLARYMPELAAFLHYRNMDVSTLKEVVRRWRPELLPGRPEKQAVHRALPDLHESIAEMRYYVEVLGLEEDELLIGEDE